MTRRSARRPLVAGMIASGIVHAAVLLSPLRIPPRMTARDRADARAAGIRVVDIALPAEQRDARRTALVAPPPALAPPPDGASEKVVATDPPATSGATFRAVAERIAPRPGDPLLRERPSIDYARTSATDRVNARIAAGPIREIADSIATEQEAARRAVDWTVKDDEGTARWGVVPDCVILAGRRRCQSTGRTGAMVEREFVRAALHHAGARTLIDARVRAIRARRDSTRTGGGGAS